MRRTYQKLVRDRIPEIIEKTGDTPVYHALSPEEYHTALDRKLDEEAAEFRASGDVEELADLLEVIHALAREQGCSPATLEAIRANKELRRGGFRNRICLDFVDGRENNGEGGSTCG